MPLCTLRFRARPALHFSHSAQHPCKLAAFVSSLERLPLSNVFGTPMTPATVANHHFPCPLPRSYSNIFVTAPSPENLRTLFEFVFKGLDELDYKVRLLLYSVNLQSFNFVLKGMDELDYKVGRCCFSIPIASPAAQPVAQEWAHVLHTCLHASTAAAVHSCVGALVAHLPARLPAPLHRLRVG